MKTRTPSILAVRSLMSRPRSMVQRRRGSAEPAAPIRAPRTTLSEFARRSASSAEESQTQCLEICSTTNGYRHLFDPERYESVSVLSPTVADTYPGYVPNRPIDLLPTASEEFGLVLCVGVLEKIHEPLGFMAELSRTMQPGAQLFLTAPLILPDPSKPQLPGRQRVGLNYLVEAAGLQIEDLIPIDRSSNYAVVGRRTRCGDGQRRADSTGAKNRPV